MPDTIVGIRPGSSTTSPAKAIASVLPSSAARKQIRHTVSTNVTRGWQSLNSSAACPGV